MSFDSKNDYYSILSLDSTASPLEVETAFKVRIEVCHPDRHASNAASVEMAKQLNAARSTLKDPARKAQYDQEKALYYASKAKPILSSQMPEFSFDIAPIIAPTIPVGRASLRRQKRLPPSGPVATIVRPLSEQLVRERKLGWAAVLAVGAALIDEQNRKK